MELLTLPQLARAKHQPTYVVDYAIAQHGPEPLGRVGNARVWHISQLPAVEESLRKTAARSCLKDRRQQAGRRS